MGALSTLESFAATLPGGPSRAPAVFLGHGGPTNAIEHNSFTAALARLGSTLPRPKAILMVSAHWLTEGHTAIDTRARAPTIHDFGGFDVALSALQYPAPGAPDYAQDIIRHTQHTTIVADHSWGLDHGCWVPLCRMYPRADVPVFQLSIDYSQPGAWHYQFGRKLSALRDTGVMIVGSGGLVHNLRLVQRNRPLTLEAATPWAAEYDAAVADALANREDARLFNPWKVTPLETARAAVPTPDHYYPLLYALGAASPDEPAITFFEGFQRGTLSLRGVYFNQQT